MRHFVMTVFNDTVVGTGTVYTDARHNDRLGQCDALSFQAVSDQVSGTSPTLTVWIEGSNDQRNWTAKNATPEINGASIGASSTNVNVGTDSGSAPSQGFVRLAIQLGGTNPVAHLKINVCGRDRS